MRCRRSCSICFANDQHSVSSIVFPWIMPIMRDRINMECKSLAVALKVRRISTKSFWIIFMSCGFISKSCSRNIVKYPRIRFNFGLMNWRIATRVSLNNRTASVSHFNGTWQSLCGFKKLECITTAIKLIKTEQESECLPGTCFCLRWEWEREYLNCNRCCRIWNWHSAFVFESYSICAWRIRCRDFPIYPAADTFRLTQDECVGPTGAIHSSISPSRNPCCSRMNRKINFISIFTFDFGALTSE